MHLRRTTWTRPCRLSESSAAKLQQLSLKCTQDHVLETEHQSGDGHTPAATIAGTLGYINIKWRSHESRTTERPASRSCQRARWGRRHPAISAKENALAEFDISSCIVSGFSKALASALIPLSKSIRSLLASYLATRSAARASGLSRWRLRSVQGFVECSTRRATPARSALSRRNSSCGPCA